METKGFSQFEIIINVSFRFIRIPILWVYGHYKCACVLLQCMDGIWTSESDVYRRQIPTTKVDPRALGVKHFRPILYLYAQSLGHTLPQQNISSF